MLRATNRLSQAEPLYRRALTIDEKSFGPHHPEVAADLNNLAGWLAAANRLSEAEPLHRRAMAILVQFTETTGHEHSHFAIAQRNYAELLAAMGRNESEIQAAIQSVLKRSRE